MASEASPWREAMRASRTDSGACSQMPRKGIPVWRMAAARSRRIAGSRNVASTITAWPDVAAVRACSTTAALVAVLAASVYAVGAKRASGGAWCRRLRISSLRKTKAPGAGPSSGASARARVDLPVPCRPPIAMTMDGAGSR